MSIRLALASLWTPERVLVGMLDRMAQITTASLDGLLERHSPGALAAIRAGEGAPGGGLPARREAMASGHNARVGALVKALGLERAVREGRDALFQAGVMLGREARERLGIGSGQKDMERAARILYRSLGIDFTLERHAEGTMMMRVRRCALAEYYASEACAVLSAADEGVVRGLNPAFTMRFGQRMTEGPPECLAVIWKEEK